MDRADVRDGHALAESGAAETLAGTEALENLALAEFVAVAGQFLADDFEQPLLAAALNVTTNPLRAEEVANQHIVARSLLGANPS
jgi:hypothetical protein